VIVAVRAGFLEISSTKPSCLVEAPGTMNSYEHLFGPFMNEIRPNLYLGSMLAAKNRDLLKLHHITHVLVAAANLPQHFPKELSYMQVPLMDEDHADLLSWFPQCIEFISSALASGGAVLVHCAAGVSRSSSVVIAYLLAKENLSVYSARESVRQKRPVINPNEGFVRQLHLFEQMGKRVDKKNWEYMRYRNEIAQYESAVVVTS